MLDSCSVDGSVAVATASEGRPLTHVPSMVRRAGGHAGSPQHKILVDDRGRAYGWGMGMSTPGPNVPSPFLGDVGKGRFLQGRHVATLEQFDGTMWLELGRYGTLQDAGVALDAAVATGADAGTLRVTQAPPKTFARVLMFVGVIAAVALIGFILYVFLAG